MLEALAQYKILERIGAGGAVYRARDTRVGRTVAIKVLADVVAHDPGRRDRFLREARATAALSHPNIAAVYEIGEDRGHLFLAFEFVPGDTLAVVMGGRPMNLRRALTLGAQLADGLADAHAAGIVHRDLAPANVIVTPKGTAKILDFGLATAAGVGERDAAVVGTASYMSPEQALGEPVDHRTDIFSLGVVLYEMVTGALPFAGKTPAAIAMQIVQTPAKAASSANAALPRELDAVIGKALAKKPDERYESAAALAAELRAVAAVVDARQESVDAVRMPTVVPSRRPSYSVIVAALVVIAVIAVVLWMLAGRP